MNALTLSLKSGVSLFWGVTPIYFMGWKAPQLITQEAVYSVFLILPTQVRSDKILSKTMDIVLKRGLVHQRATPTLLTASLMHIYSEVSPINGTSR